MLNIDDFLSYLPIIVECCWTAASRSLSSIVHSPISVHPETGAHSTSHSIRGEKNNNTRLFPFYCPMHPVLSAQNIDHGPSLLRGQLLCQGITGRSYFYLSSSPKC